MSNKSATEEDDDGFPVPPSLSAEWMNMAEAKRELSFTRWHISNMCRDGVLQRRKYGRYTLISRASVTKFLARWKTPCVKTTKRKRRA